MSVPDPLAVVIDRTPHPYLLPNSGKAERTRRPYRQALRDSAAVAAQNALRGREWAWNGPILITVEIYWEKGRKRADWDNAIASIKGAVDGVFAKLDANDRQVAGIHLRQEHDKLGDGCTVILVEAQP